jgi:hypothetical protein
MFASFGGWNRNVLEWTFGVESVEFVEEVEAVDIFVSCPL